ncbi:MAG: DUF6252 family protein [Flavobacteriaceae bacterium]|nr:DUF6252 family protein [Flavobacteriaceae bacterium]
MLNKKITLLFLFIFVLLTGCDNDVEINVPESIDPPVTSFQVDFDGETWVADSITATITNGITSIRAFRNDDKEIIVINLLSDQVGSYVIDPAVFIGNIIYTNTEDLNGDFSSNRDVISGIIKLTINDEVSKILAGEFFFTGSRLVQELDENEMPVLDENENPIYLEEIKDFTNGNFQNINYIEYL